MKKDILKFDGTLYRDHLILFIDILGYSSLMLSNDEAKKQAVLNLQKGFVESDQTGHLATEIISTEQKKIYIKPLACLLSDTVIYSFPIEELAARLNDSSFDVAYQFIANQIVRVHMTFMEHGMLVRGAVCIGKISNSDGIAYGEGLAHANCIQKKGKSPFIYFDENILSHMTKYQFGRDAKKYLIQGSDTPYHYFDYLESNFRGEKRPNFFGHLDFHIPKIKENLSATNNDPNATKKWDNIAKYYENKIIMVNERITSSYQEDKTLYHKHVFA